jgi:hypothetical protein
MENIENTQMETTEINQPIESPVTINSDIKSYLLETAKWCKFLAIAGFIGMGILVLLGLCISVGFSVFARISHVGFPMGIFGFFYVLIAAIYFFPLNYMYRFSINLTRGINLNNQPSVTYGFENLKSLFKFMGILTIVVLSIYALAIVVMIPVAIFTAFR